MASSISSILDMITRKMSERAGSRPGSGSGGLLGQLTDFLGQRKSAPTGSKRNVRPASEDPYGDPADQKGAKKVKPASEDPYGDPADEK